MTNFNFGIIKATFTNYLNESENLFAKELFTNFMKLIKEEAVLQAQFQVYKNLEDKHIVNENLAIKYIDENLNVIKKWPHAVLDRHNAVLAKICEGLKPKVSEKKKTLYENIQTLIDQTLNTTDVDQLHESYSYVLNHIKTNEPKNLVIETANEFTHVPQDFLIKKAIEKFNNKYNGLNEAEKELFLTIISENTDAKNAYFVNLKSSTTHKLKSLLGENEVVDKNINEAISKIEKMKFNEETFSTDVLSLKELKESLN